MNRAPTWVRPAANEDNARGRGMRPARPRMTGPVIPTKKPRARSEGAAEGDGRVSWVDAFQVSGLSDRETGAGGRVRVGTALRAVRPQDHGGLGEPRPTWIRPAANLLGRAGHPWSAAVEQGCSTLPAKAKQRRARAARGAAPTLTGSRGRAE